MKSGNTRNQVSQRGHDWYGTMADRENDSFCSTAVENLVTEDLILEGGRFHGM